MAFPLVKKKHRPPVRHPEVRRKLSVHEKTLSRIGECVAQLGAGRKDEAEKVFFDAVRQFFADFIPIHYKFTYEELRQDLEKKHLSDELKGKVAAFLTSIADAEYHPAGVTKEQLTGYLFSFGEIVDALKAELIEIPASEHAVHPVWEPLGKVLHLSGPEKQIKDLLAEGEHKAAAMDILGARQAYEEIDKIFQTLPDREKESYYPKIMDFYHKLIALS